MGPHTIGPWRRTIDGARSASARIFARRPAASCESVLDLAQVSARTNKPRRQLAPGAAFRLGVNFARYAPLVSSIFKGTLLFAAGVVFALLVLRPAPERRDVAPDPGAGFVAARWEPAPIGVVPGWSDPGERAPGLPPVQATSPDPPPNNNPKPAQRRALARALDELERHPPEIEAAPVDTAASAAVGQGLRAALQHLEPQGETP